MAFQTVSTQVKYFKYSDCKKGDILVASGTYKGSREGKFGVVHDFMEDTGIQVTLNKAGQLDYLVEHHLTPGKKCRITFEGKEKLTRGDFKGKDANKFSLALDNETHEAPAECAPVMKAAPADTNEITL
jgi:hypothetical protein